MLKTRQKPSQRDKSHRLTPTPTTKNTNTTKTHSSIASLSRHLTTKTKRTPTLTTPSIDTNIAHSSRHGITPVLTSKRRLAYNPRGGNNTGNKKLSQAELIIQQHREKQQAAELEKIRAAQAAKAAGTPPPSQQQSNKKGNNAQAKNKNNNNNAAGGYNYEKPLQQPSKEFLRDQKQGKMHKLPPGMTIEDLNKMPPEVIAKTLNIDMAMIDALNDEREDDFAVQFSEDSNADATPPLPFRPDPGEEGVKYAAARIQGRHTVNMMPSVPPRPANHKGRVTIIRKLPPQFETVHKNLRKVTQALLRAQKLSHFDLAVTLVAAQGMQFINRQHRFVDAPTDVLAFTMEEPYTEGIPVELGNIADLGEIILSVPYVYAQASIRHAMLRSLGHDLSDSRRPLSEFEKVQKLFQNVGNIKIDENGGLVIQQLAEPTQDNGIVDIEEIDEGGNPVMTKNRNKFGPNTEKIAGLLPSITLNSSQLDSLPPFDKDYIISQVDNAMSPEQRQQVKMMNMSKKAQKAAELLESLGPQQMQLTGNNSSSGGADPTNTTTTDITTNSNKNKNNSIADAPTWHLSQGFPPRDYFRYITESMVVDEMNIVLIHGFLHLCGYDHDTAEKRQRMQQETDRVVDILLEEGVISQRCADLSTLYVLDDAPEYVEEPSEDELLPAGLFMDNDGPQMSDKDIKKRIKELQSEGDDDDDDYDNGNDNANNKNTNIKGKNSGAFSSKTTQTFDPTRNFDLNGQKPSSRAEMGMNSKKASQNAQEQYRRDNTVDAAKQRNTLIDADVIDINNYNNNNNNKHSSSQEQGGKNNYQDFSDIVTQDKPSDNVRQTHSSQKLTQTVFHGQNKPIIANPQSFDIFKQKKPSSANTTTPSSKTGPTTGNSKI